jgi:hypothetical protein
MPTNLPPVEQNAQDFPIDESRTIRISDLISLRVYHDTRPHNLKIANLQKGLIFVYERNELVGEGTGFGLPILVCSQRPRRLSTKPSIRSITRKTTPFVHGYWTISRTHLKDHLSPLSHPLIPSSVTVRVTGSG